MDLLNGILDYSSKDEIKRLLAKNRYAKCPEGVSKRSFAAIRAAMERRFMDEWIDTPPGLYSDSEIWAQTFAKYL